MEQHERKAHKVAFETEFLVLEDNGAVSSRVDDIMKIARKTDLDFFLRKEYTHNMLEITSNPNVKVRKSAHAWLREMRKVVEIAKKIGLRLYPYGTYTGTFAPTARTDKYYRMCETVLGPSRYVRSTGRSIGFHLHYCLPYRTFNRQTRRLATLFKSKYKEELLNVYNLILALDPAMTNFMESSPFVDGVYHAKDSRLFLYRSMTLNKKDRYLEGLYADREIWGGLPRYAHSITDLIMLTEKRYRAWMGLLKREHPEYLRVARTRHPLQFNWSPLRINKLGTFEYRGMDMNLPSHIIGTSLLFKSLFKKVRSEEITVRPCDIGIKEPFKIEGQNMYVPPYHYLDEKLQYYSALKGFEDAEVFKYSKSMASLAIKAMPNRKDPGISKILQMLESRKTKSDELLARARKRGQDIRERLDEGVAQEMALEACDEFEKELEILPDKELLIDLMEE
ncbi:MAG: hypothetical protein Q7T16_05340 [Candidatus Burarchaeum sp.]|nr:hypothetical protein [Candidatus Burarchaeum sp.]MDO8340054.1 hypothetical protein [Candidatus Burarchaeum sp.]